MNRPEMLKSVQTNGMQKTIFVLGLLFLLLLTLLWADLRMTERYFVVEIVGTSMENTLENGDLVYAERQFNVERGDVVIIDVSRNAQYEEAAHRKGDKIVKRVVAMEGDSIKAEDGVVYLKVAGGAYTALDETYTKGMNVRGEFEEVILKEGEVFLLGDNRDISLDSRLFGAVPFGDIVGKVPAWAIRSRAGITKWETFRASFSGWLTFPSGAAAIQK